MKSDTLCRMLQWAWSERKMTLSSFTAHTIYSASKHNVLADQSLIEYNKHAKITAMEWLYSCLLFTKIFGIV